MDMAEMAAIETSGLRGEFQHNVPMGRHVSWRAGGAAHCAYTPADLDDLCDFVTRLPEQEPLLVVGLGSNLLIRDGGFPGTVLFMHGVLGKILLEQNSEYSEIYAEAGVPSPKVARLAANNDLEGAEFLAGIPGTVGGALAMNAGCFGTETWSAIARVRTVDRTGRLQIREPHDYAIGYRSVLPLQAADEIFVAAWFQFTHGDGNRARKRVKELLAKRLATQPLAEANAGSVFRNPPGNVAARLIEQSGLKGKRIGGAEVSIVHANFIINTGDATARDIEQLIALVQETVERETGIMLEREVRIVGEA
jgi:UDP-N-acetylmuramate dehydrogenase